MSYDEFWRQYLRAHARPSTRGLHYAGSLCGLVALVIGGITREWPWFVAAPAVGYAFAWGAHLGLEGNRPQTFGHPAWSLASDFRMLWLWSTGRLGPHLRKVGI